MIEDMFKDIKQILSNGKTTVGGWMQIPDTSVAEIMGRAGYDWVALDMEHAVVNPERMVEIFRALALGGTLPFVRLGRNDSYLIKQALEAGAKGVIAPMINTPEDARNFIDWSTYTPVGKRGVGYSRANLFGKNFDDHMQNFDRDLIRVVQIEDIQAVQNIETILRVEGIDALIVGPYDLSASMKLTGQFEHPDVVAAIETIHKAAKQFKVAMGLHVVQPRAEDLQQKIDQGIQFLAYATDAIFLYQSCERPLQAS